MKVLKCKKCGGWVFLVQRPIVGVLPQYPYFCNSEQVLKKYDEVTYG